MTALLAAAPGRSRHRHQPRNPGNYCERREVTAGGQAIRADAAPARRAIPPGEQS